MFLLGSRKTLKFLWLLRWWQVKSNLMEISIIFYETNCITGSLTNLISVPMLPSFCGFPNKRFFYEMSILNHFFRKKSLLRSRDIYLTLWYVFDNFHYKRTFWSENQISISQKQLFDNFLLPNTWIEFSFKNLKTNKITRASGLLLSY